MRGKLTTTYLLLFAHLAYAEGGATQSYFDPSISEPPVPESPSSDPIPHSPWIQPALRLTTALEIIETQKLELSLPSTQVVPGIDAELQSPSERPLYFFGEAAGHHHAATVEDTDVLGSNTSELALWRLDLDSGLGWNFFAGDSSSPRWSFAPYLAAAYMTFPRVPIAFHLGGKVAPDLESTGADFYGAGLRFGMPVGMGALEGRAAYLISPFITAGSATRLESRLVWTSPLWPSTSLDLGLYQRHLAYTRCDPDPAQCLAWGKLHTYVDEVGFVGGLSTRFP
jgi:hypothetical protein